LRKKSTLKNPNEILIGDSIFPIQTRKEILKVKGQEPIEFEIRETVHGPILNPVYKEIASLTQNPVSSWWVYTQEPTKAIEAIYRMNHAKDIQEVADAAALIHAPGLNIMYGDAEGNIAWWAAAKLPIRGSKVHSKIFADGSDPESQPKGWYPFTENPQSVNPESGFVASANNQPDSTQSGIFFPGYYYPGDRWERISKEITSSEKWDLDATKHLQLETINETSPQIAKFLISQINRDDFVKYEDALVTLEYWYGDHPLKSISPTIYYKWLYHTLRLAMEDELGEESFKAYLETFMMVRSNRHFITLDNNPWWDNKKTEAKENRSEIVTEALKITFEELSKQLGNDTDKWFWEKAVTIEHPHPLGSQKPLDKFFNVRTGPVEANEESVNKLAFDLNGEGIYKVTSGPAMRIILDFGDVESSVSVLPTGNSGNRFSRYYADQKELYAKGKYRPQLMNESKIKNDAKSTLILYPKD